ncbi:MAG: CHASE domain-containing protein [Bacteroidetes bacterium]|nr:CHASE domain-containing protein [Bacteroidota bacterium]
MFIQTDYIFFIFTGIFAASFIFLLYLMKKRPGYISWIGFVSLLFLYIIGMFAANWQGNIKDTEIRNHLKIQVEAIARTINREQIKGLSFSGADTNNTEYIQLCNELKAYKNGITSVFGTQEIIIYSMLRRNNAILFGPESAEAKTRYASPPGSVYDSPTPLLLQLFSNGNAFTGGPYTDEFGKFISAFAPVFDPATGKVLLVVGIDIGYKEVQSAISHQIMFAYLCVVLLLFVILMSGFLQAVSSKKLWLNVEYINVIAFGLSLTLIFALVLHQNGTKSRNSVFIQVAEPEAENICKAFVSLRDFQITPIARYFSGSTLVTRESFHALLAPMFRLSGRQTSIGWIIPIDNSQKGKMELQARQEGIKDFTIWQTSSIGEKIPASGRNIFFPFWYFESPGGSPQFYGYDLSSDPAIRKTIDKAMKTGLPAATDPVILSFDKEKQARILVFQPVFSSDTPTRKFKGFIVAVVDPELFIQKAISTDNAEKLKTVIDFYQLSAEKSPLPVAIANTNQPTHFHENSDDLTINIRDYQAVIFPIFVFDKTYAAYIFPAPGSYAFMPVYAGWIAFAIGVLLTFLMTVLTLLLTRRNENLEHQVEIRTFELRKSEAELRELNSTKDKFFSIIAHDLRSPFNSFLGFTQIMVEELDDMTLDEIKTIVMSMRKSATNVYSLLENLLEWSLMQRGITPFNPVLIPLAVNIKQNIELLIVSAQKKEIEIVYDIPENIMIFADVHILETVIRNLFSNAVKFTPRKGKITLSAKKTESNSVQVSIADTGIGMKKELISKLFQLSENTNRKGTEGEPSIGLGLLICKDFIEKHDGKIWVESEEGNGSVFSFTFPFRNERLPVPEKLK